jgi:Carboxypeptidase regulatory-like domain/TonB-dependent Receptor Plug Domain
MKISVISILFFSLSVTASAQVKNTGSVRGTVIENGTQNPVPDALVFIIELGDSTVTSISGVFQFDNIPFETYSIRISAPGYESQVKTDVVVLSSRPAEVNVELIQKGYTTETIDVEAKYFQKSPDENASNFNLDFEEVRRAPGAVEDISRMVQVLPGVAPGNDQRNDLIVRGGSPSENLTLIDGIEIPNINHYPTQASSSGPIGMINVKFIGDVNFSTGGFSSRYGDKLSSVLNVKFREGYRKRFLSDINLSTAGFGGVFEGPLFSKKGSFLVSARRSYLNLIRGAIRIAAVPNYWDFNVKTVYDINQNNKLEFLGIAGLDDISFEGDASKISDDNPYGKAKGNQQEFTAGFNWKSLFKNGYVQTVLANSSNFYKYVNYDIKTDELIFDYNSYESDFNMRSEAFYQLNRSNNIIFGAGGRFIKFKNKLYVRADTSAFGDPLPVLNVDTRKDFYKGSGFIQYTLKLLKDKILFNAGMRYDYFSGINDKHSVSPRAGLSYKLTAETTMNFSTGIFTQAPEYLWVTSDPKNVNLKYIRSYHYVAGIEHLFTEDLRLSVETYYKKYTDYPVSVLIPTFALVNGGTENGPNFVGEASSKGFGHVKGIDISIQKKLTGSGFYGMLNYSLSESRITALEGGEKPGSFDYRHNLTIIAGYQLPDDWLVGIKFRYTTGRPYTPFDIQASTIAGRGVYLSDKFNEARFKDYNRLDIRVDKKWNFKKWSIVSYVELQNVFNTTNVYQYFWNEYKNEVGTIYQWAFLPVGGISVQF